jgi:hypothetical protein
VKTNPALQKFIGFQNSAQRVWYAAHVLKAALTNSPAVIVSPAVPARAAKPEVIAQTAKPARAASAAVIAANNTTGYAFGELYLNSPAYPAGTAIPAIPPKPASAAVVGSPAVTAIAASPAITSPAIVALKGWEDAISITRANDALTVTAELPVATSVGIFGSQLVAVGEITLSTLQASAWVDSIVYSLGFEDPINAAIPTLEKYLYEHGQQCEHLVTDTIRNVNGTNIPCKKIVVTMYPSSSFVFESTSPQLSGVRMTANTGS